VKHRHALRYERIQTNVSVMVMVIFQVSYQQQDFETITIYTAFTGKMLCNAENLCYFCVSEMTFELHHAKEPNPQS
jgi:hypothetical protein